MRFRGGGFFEGGFRVGRSLIGGPRGERAVFSGLVFWKTEVLWCVLIRGVIRICGTWRWVKDLKL